MYKLSIVIPVYNKAKFTQSCLNDLFQLNTDHEIIVINNNSKDNTKTILEDFQKEHSNLVVINNDTNVGFAKAVNQGYQISKADKVLFLNNDIRVKSNHSNWTDILINNCDDSLCGPTFGLLDNNLNFVKEANEELVGNSYLSGWCLAGSKDVFEKLIIDNYVGPFTEAFITYFEDTDLSFRARKLNIPLKLVNVPVVHFGKITSSQLNTTMLYTKAKKKFIKKWKNNK